MAGSDIFGLEAFELLLVAKLVGLVLKRAELAAVMHAVEGSADRIANLVLTIVKMR
jgi:hypothetical protein